MVLTLRHARWSAAPPPRTRQLRLAGGEPAALPALPPGDAGPQTPAPRAARRREARVRVPAVRDAVRVEDRAARAEGVVSGWARTSTTPTAGVRPRAGYSP